MYENVGIMVSWLEYLHEKIIQKLMRAAEPI